MVLPRRHNSLNCVDAPELVLGARADFQQSCLAMHAEDVHALGNVRELAPHVVELQLMFPDLEPTLVQEVYAEALTAQDAVDTLLAIVPGAPSASGKVQSSRTGRDPAQDYLEFPSLVGSDGWEVVNSRSVVDATSEDLGRDWCERVKAAAELPAPNAKPTSSLNPRRSFVLRNGQGDSSESIELETDYESRQRQGKQRAENRAKYPRKPRSAYHKEEATAGVNSSSDDDPQGMAPAWRSLRLENRL